MKRTLVILLAIMVTLTTTHDAFARGPEACTDKEVRNPDGIFVVVNFDVRDPIAVVMTPTDATPSIVMGGFNTMPVYTIHSPQPTFEIPKWFEVEWNYVVWDRGLSQVVGVQIEGDKAFATQACHVERPGYHGFPVDFNGMTMFRDIWGPVYKINPR